MCASISEDMCTGVSKQIGSQHVGLRKILVAPRTNSYQIEKHVKNEKLLCSRFCRVLVALNFSPMSTYCVKHAKYTTKRGTQGDVSGDVCDVCIRI